MAAANSPKSFTHALRSLVQLFVCTIATGAPAGVVTTSMSRCTCRSGASSTCIENADVPTLMLPVRLRTAFVLTMPVPASPSGGARSAPGASWPLRSRRRAPSAVRWPAHAPARSTRGRISRSRHGCASTRGSASNFAASAASYVPLASSTGNIPDASPMPSTRSPESRQCTYPASVVRKSISLTDASPFRMA